MNQSNTSGATDLLRDARGLSTVEYVIVLVLIAAAAVGTWSVMGQTVRGKVKASIGEIRQVNVK